MKWCCLMKSTSALRGPDIYNDKTCILATKTKYDYLILDYGAFGEMRVRWLIICGMTFWWPSVVPSPRRSIW